MHKYTCQIFIVEKEEERVRLKEITCEKRIKSATLSLESRKEDVENDDIDFYKYKRIRNIKG